MKILITGASGFVGKNLVTQLNNIKLGKMKHPSLGNDLQIIEYNRNSDFSLLASTCSDVDFVFHLAGTNRPKNEDEFFRGNIDFTLSLLDELSKNNNYCPVVFASSTQAELENAYGKSKKGAEDAIRYHFEQQGYGDRALVYRFPNIFGKWCKPNYNSVIATFCYNIAHDLPITLNDANVELTLVYIDDVVNELISALTLSANRKGDFCVVPTVHRLNLGLIVDLLLGFKIQRESLSLPNVTDNTLEKKLYSTFLSYLPVEKFSYPLKMNVDERGSFTEIVKTTERGQFSVNISKPGIVKGQHWHHTKNEKFVVLSGHGRIQLRRVGKDEDGNDYPVNDFYVSGYKIEVVEMIPGYTHNITNLSDTDDLVTLMWANESFDPNHPDTFSEDV